MEQSNIRKLLLSHKDLFTNRLFSFLCLGIILALVSGFVSLVTLNVKLSNQKQLVIVENLTMKEKVANYDVLKNEYEKSKFKVEYFLQRFAVDKYDSRGKLISTNSQLDEILDAAWKYGNLKGISPMLAMMVIHIESRNNPKAISSKGAMGLMQIMYSLWQEEFKLDISQMFKIPYNMEYGLEIFKRYLKLAKGDVIKALRIYNGGPGGMEFTGTYPFDVLQAFSVDPKPIDDFKYLLN
jgi:soluble lytic murein transglycosylase-like protein